MGMVEGREGWVKQRRCIARFLLILLLLVPIIALAQADLAREAVAFVEAFLLGAPGQAWARLSTPARASLSEDAFAAWAWSLKARWGTLLQVQEASDFGTVVNLLLRMERGDLSAQLRFAEDGMVTSIAVEPAGLDVESESLGMREEVVRVGEHALYGVVSWPEVEDELLPAAVLLHGSGPSDHNAALGDTAILRDIAQGLQAQGFVALRYEKRTHAWQRGSLSATADEVLALTVREEILDDALAAVALLRADPRVDPSRIFLIGHSQGGMLLPRLERMGAGAAGLIVLAGTLRPLCEVTADQLEALDAGGMAEEIALARALPGMPAAEVAGRTLLGQPAAYYWEEAQYDAARLVVQNATPMLIVQGTEDDRLSLERDYALWEALVEAHPHLDVTVSLYGGLGHFLVAEGVFSPAVLTDMVHWMHAR